MSVLVALFVVSSSLYALATFFPGGNPAGTGMVTTPYGSGSSLSNTTYDNVTFTGNASHDFPAGALLYTNFATPWGSSNNISNLYGTWNGSTLFISVSGIKIASGNNFMLAISNSSAYGTVNLSSTNVSAFDRDILFSQPMNFFFFMNSSMTLLHAYMVTSAPSSSTTVFVNLTKSEYFAYNNVSSNGNLEVAVNFTALFNPFPAGATVSLYSSIFGGNGGWVGPTIPSGQSFNVTWMSPPLTSHDIGPYVYENTFYSLYLDPLKLGHAETGITPNFVPGFAFHTVKFTGNPSRDFLPAEQSLINTNTIWGTGNLLNSSYVTWNETTLFVGINESVTGNNIALFLSNGTASGYGTYNLSALPTPYSSLSRNFSFTVPVNFILFFSISGSGVFSSPYFLKVSSTTSQSNASTTLVNLSGSISFASSAHGFEFGVPFRALYGFGAGWPFFRPFSNISMLAGVVGGSGPWIGPTLPAGQSYPTSGTYYNQYHKIGSFDLLNTFFTIPLDPYGDGFPAPQVNPTYSFGKTLHNVVFSGNVSKDFAAQEIIGTNSATPWGTSSNTLSDLYLTWNFSNLFAGTIDSIGSGNNLMIVISNDTMTGSTNLSTTNVPALQRNITFSAYINFVFAMSAGSSAGTLYEVIPSQTNSTQTNFSTVGTFAAAADGAEFTINFTTLYPNQPSGSSTDSVPLGATVSAAALIYGGSGPWVGPTIPSGQTYSSSNGPFEHITSLLTRGLDPNHDGYAEPGITPSVVAISYVGAPIKLNIVFNDHQPLYAPVGYPYWMLAWTAVHLQEYAEQALIIHMYPSVNITYSLSGSLLYQIEAIAQGEYNNSYLMAAFIPQSQWNNSLYTEITQYHDSFLFSFAPQYAWNTTTVRDVLEYDLAFNTPLWVYSAGTPASSTYKTLFNLEQAGTALNNTALTNALVEFFLWSVSYPIVTGMLGSQYINSTIFNLYNQTSFVMGDIGTIMHYYPSEANLTISAFRSDMMLNSTLAGNVELLTTPFDHPILPLLLINNWTGASGDQIVKGVWSNDTLAQLNIGKQMFYNSFGQYPVGLWSPEQAVSGAIVPFLNQTGYLWTSSADSTLAETGISVPSGTTATAQQMENLYQPYRVQQNGTSEVMVFRDSTLSNDWGFNYGNLANTQGNWAPVGALMSYLKNIYATVPRSDHSNVTVTVALDGENWMFFNPFPFDAVPFLKDLYLGLQQNETWLSTVTMQQYVAGAHSPMPVISNLPVGSWNPQPTGNGISEYLGQWAGHTPQDASWQQLSLVRSMVVSYGLQNGLKQPMNLTMLETAMAYPSFNSWNLTMPQQKYDRAWMDIYGAEGSDIYFAFDPADQSLTAQNAVVFEYILRYDLSNALQVLGLPLTPFLKGNWTSPLTPSVYGTNGSITPPLTGTLYSTGSFDGRTAYSINNNFAWNGAYQYSPTGGQSGSQGINTVYYAFDPNNLYFAISVNGPTSAYVAPNSYTQAPLAIQLYLSQVNPGQGDLSGLSIPNSVFSSSSGQSLGFAATSMVTVAGQSVTPSGSGNIVVYNSGPKGNWIYNTTVPDAFIGNVIEIEIPMSDLGMIPGNSITFSVATVNQTTGSGNLAGPLSMAIPSSLAKLTTISVIHNTAPSDGPGNYTYPILTQDYPPNSVQMRWVNVSVNQFLVQFNFTFGNLTNPFGGSYGFTQPIIDIYIHESNGTAGSTAMLPGPNANVSSAFAWQWAIQADGFPANAYIQSYTGQTYSSSLLITSNLTSKTVSVEAPLSLIGNNIAHYGYVIVAGFQDGYGTNGWDPVLTKATDYQGGGSGGPNSPNIYSYIAPSTVNSSSTLTQESVLSTYTSAGVAVLPGIYLPITTPVTTKTGVTQPSYSAVGYDALSSQYMAFYDINNTVYWSSSSGGQIWSSPKLLLSSPANIRGLSFYSLSAAAYLLVATATTYSVVNLTSGISITNFTFPSVTVSSSITSVNGEFYVFAATASTVSVINSAGSVIGTLAVAATNISAYSTQASTFLSYTDGSYISAVEVSLNGSKAAFSASQIRLVNASAGSKIGQLSLSVNANDQFVVSYVSTNSTGSNILVSYGTGGNMSTVLVTTDGLDNSPSTIISVSGNTTSVMIGFTNGANAGNVYFIPKPVATFTYTAHVTPVKSGPSSAFLTAMLLIGAGVAVAVIGVAAYFFTSRKKKVS